MHNQEQTFLTDDTSLEIRDLKKLKRKFTKKARSGFSVAEKLAQTNTKIPLKTLTLRNESFKNGIVGLWFLGFTVDQIVCFVNIDKVGQEYVLGALRRYFATLQTDLIADVIIRLQGSNCGTTRRLDS